jgi:hypothetical protein
MEAAERVLSPIIAFMMISQIFQTEEKTSRAKVKKPKRGLHVSESQQTK